MARTAAVSVVRRSHRARLDHDSSAERVGAHDGEAITEHIKALGAIHLVTAVSLGSRVRWPVA